MNFISRNKVYEQILRQNIGFFDKNSPGEISSVLTSNIDKVKTAIGYKLGDFISMGSRGLASIIFSLVMAWKFSIVFLCFIPLMVMCTFLLITFIKKYTIEEFNSYGASGQMAVEALSSIRTVLSLGIHRKLISLYEESLGSAESMTRKKGLATGIVLGTNLFLLNTVFGIGIYWAVYLVRTECEHFGVDRIMSAFFTVVVSSFALGQAIPYLKDLAEAKGAAKKIYSILETKSEIDIMNSGNKKLSQLKGDIVFKDVQFSYPVRMEAKILKGLHLHIPAGKTVALVGSR